MAVTYTYWIETFTLGDDPAGLTLRLNYMGSLGWQLLFLTGTAEGGVERAAWFIGDQNATPPQPETPPDWEPPGILEPPPAVPGRATDPAVLSAVIEALAALRANEGLGEKARHLIDELAARGFVVEPPGP